MNAFEGAVERTDPELVASFALYANKAAPVRLHLCGAGPAVYLFVREQARVSLLQRDFEGMGATVFPTRTVSREVALAIEELP